MSVDPERGTTDKIRAYVKAIHEDAIGLRGELTEIKGVTADYSVSFEKEWAECANPESDPYTVALTATVFLIDSFGQLRAGLLSPTPDDVAHDVTLILRESTG